MFLFWLLRILLFVIQPCTLTLLSLSLLFSVFHTSFLYLSEWFINRERFLSGTHPPFTHLSDPKYVTFIIIPLHFIWDQDVVRYIWPRPLYHLYDLFNNTSPVGNPLGNEAMCCRWLIVPPTRKNQQNKRPRVNDVYDVSDDVSPTRIQVEY